MKVSGHTTGSSYFPAVNPPEFHVGSAGGEMEVCNVNPAEIGYEPHPAADEIDIVVQVEATVDDGEIIGWEIEGAWHVLESGNAIELELSNFPAKLIDRIEQQAEDEAYEA